MEFILVPYEGTDKCKLGMKSIELQTIFKQVPEKFKKSSDDEQDTDDYGFCQIFYDENGCVEAFEFSSPAKVYFSNVQLVGSNYIIAENIFKQFDDQLIYESGFCSNKLDIGIYCPDAPEGKVEAVLIGKKNYYSE